MQATSETYKALLRDMNHVKEVKMTVAGVEYAQGAIVELSTYGGALPELSIGNCMARELDVTFIPTVAPPRMAEIRLYVRLVSGALASEWLPKGVYYIDTRETDELTGALTVHGFDAMLKAERVWADPSRDAREWPMAMTAAVADICARMGVTLDSRTALNAAYQVEYPNDYTMREVLGHVAAAHGGNWIMTDAGKLLLLRLGDIPAETRYLVDDADGAALLFGNVRIVL